MLDVTKKTFKTSDFYMAAFLKTAGFPLVEVVKDNKKKFFVFEDNNNMAIKIQTEYVNGTSKVAPKELIDNIRALKTLTNME